MQLELVCDRADDRDAETAFGELLTLERRRTLRVEALPVVDDFDGERAPVSSYAIETNPAPSAYA